MVRRNTWKFTVTAWNGNVGKEVKKTMDIGMLIISFIPAIIFIGAVVIMELVFNVIYDHSQKFKEWADSYLYEE